MIGRSTLLAATGAVLVLTMGDRSALAAPQGSAPAAPAVNGHFNGGPPGRWPGPAGATRPVPAIDKAGIENRWGIQIDALRLTAAGYMLDFRYRVVDPAKAAPLFDRKTRAILTDEKSGAVMFVPTPPKTGPLRSTNDPKPGRVYFMFFANPGRFIHKSQRVTVTIGEFSVSGLIVRQ